MSIKKNNSKKRRKTRVLRRSFTTTTRRPQEEVKVHSSIVNVKLLPFLKFRIIQNYIMRDQAGALATPEADAHKEKFRRKSGIMASVFSGSAQKISSDMTLELSIEINRKMQAVLEDTLLKNITLKVTLHKIDGWMDVCTHV